MGKPYSIDLRERVVASVRTGGLSCHQAAKRFGVGISTAINWVRRLRETGSVAPGKMGGYRPKLISGKLQQCSRPCSKCKSNSGFVRCTLAAIHRASSLVSSLARLATWFRDMPAMDDLILGVWPICTIQPPDDFRSLPQLVVGGKTPCAFSVTSASAF
jgi:transposase